VEGVLRGKVINEEKITVHMKRRHTHQCTSPSVGRVIGGGGWGCMAMVQDTVKRWKRP
jgi:predicted Rossmann-fold nucleotide-binding protein